MRNILVLLFWCVVLPAAAAPAGTAPPTILVMGDSLSAAYGMPLESGWVRLLQQRLRQQGYPHRVVNGSVSGETTAGGLARLPATLRRHKPEIVLIELGANDGLRGLPLKQLRVNLDRLSRYSRAAGARVALFEMRIPPNYGQIYTQGFQDSFAVVARAHRATVVPFFLARLLEREGMFQDDGIHPTAAGQPLMLDAVWPALEPLLRESKSAKTAYWSSIPQS